MDEADGMNIDEFEAILSKAKRDCQGQMFAIREKLRKYIKSEEQHTLLCSMIEHLVFLNANLVKAETVLRSEKEMIKEIKKVIDSIMATRLAITLSYVNTDSGKEDVRTT